MGGPVCAVKEVMSGNKNKIAALVRRVPFLLEIGVRLWRLRIPCFTAGVVGVVVNAQGDVLLLEHVYHPKYAWGLPGGWIDRRENPDDAVMREVMEETGLLIAVERPLVTRANPYRPHLDFAYLCHPHKSAQVRHLSGEILAYRWVDPMSGLPPMDPFHLQALQTAFPKAAP